MKSKISIGLLIVIVLMTMFTSCSETDKPLAESAEEVASRNENAKSLIECGQDVISLMDEMVDNEAYGSLYNLPTSCDEIKSNLRDGNYSESSAVYELSISADKLFKSLDMDIDKDSFSEDLYKYVCASAYTSFATQVNAASGAEAVSTSATFTAQKCFVNDSVDANKIYLYVFENASPIAIAFVTEGDGSVRAIGQFIISNTFITDDEQSIIESCEALGIAGVTVKSIK